MKRNNKDKNEFDADWINANINNPIVRKKPTTINKITEKKINEYITLKLQGGRTFIYVNGKRFIQCIRLILSIPTEDVHEYDEVDSIDEAAQLYSRHIHQNRLVRGPMARPLANQRHTITPEQEFWGHCSNIQAWVEHDYDTRILMRNISFPLLRELVKAGDPKATKFFKEEIAQRLESGYPSVVEYLLNQGYLKYFTPPEFKTIIETTNLIKGLSSNPKMLSRFLVFCVPKFPTLVEDILRQVLKVPKGKDIIISSRNISDIPRMPFLRKSFRTTPQYLVLVKSALKNLLTEANEETNEEIMECIIVIEKELELQKLDFLHIPGESRLEAIRKLYFDENILENLGEEEKALLLDKFLHEIKRVRSRCAYCGKEIPRGQDVCEWCGHKKDDDKGFFPYPYIYKPPGGGGGGRLKEGAIVIPVKI